MRTWHRHHPPPVGQIFGAADDTSILRAVAIVGRPVAHHLDAGATPKLLRPPLLSLAHFAARRPESSGTHLAPVPSNHSLPRQAHASTEDLRRAISSSSALAHSAEPRGGPYRPSVAGGRRDTYGNSTVHVP
ncbi:hypothetical protein AB0O05_02970 [Streptomyces sp. NPDC093084]|uniref:hypothetical protein n=1 Tax=Streptomyces sp. NPDC093084 TaxID=3155197 RepID=UPI0034304D3C